MRASTHPPGLCGEGFIDRKQNHGECRHTAYMGIVTPGLAPELYDGFTQKRVGSFENLPHQVRPNETWNHNQRVCQHTRSMASTENLREFGGETG